MPEVTTQGDPEDSLKLSGRALDFAVAERVMGWVRGTRWGNGNGEWTIDGKGYNEHHKTWNQTPHFSSEIKAAMEVVTALVGNPDVGWTVEMRSDDERTDKRWFVEFVTGDQRFLYTGEGASDSLPEAICKAALAAIETKQ